MPNLSVCISGAEIDPGTFMSLMYPWDDTQSDFNYLKHHLFKLGGILTAAQKSQPVNKDLKGDPI